ncbi:hypothetical protein Isop_1908 [Isosphaera pallida ATCC 43644]|jgi:hypothetical protein|uniref:Uncharacterized protein n=1 Tax=Isosphaera pallida (strain ATCC 43644 / DSM 9630 / IS1B) TaxID=575540 RepID=E8R2I8_ISOPI|nr:hypothetical protein Isop_1908 [Isosphaera pallida ATCC 43644]
MILHVTAGGIGHWFNFVTSGVAIAAIGEWQDSVFSRDDLANGIGSLVFNAMFLTRVGLVRRVRWCGFWFVVGRQWWHRS